MKPFALMAAALAALCLQAADLPKVSIGRVERLADFPSRHVDPRHVDVWLPDGYSPDKRYRVLYMHDGQMLFDADSTWNKQEWGVDEVAGALLREGRLHDLIVVGIWNNGPLRHSEYFPEKTLATVPAPLRQTLIDQALGGKPRSDAYLRFLVEELKPVIDRKYATRPERDATYIMGSSMGGIISLYAISEYPAVFGAAACLSTHWIGTRSANASLPLAVFNYLAQNLPDPKTHRLYLDRGNQGLDALYGPAQTFADELIRERGYTEANWQTRVFAEADHTERDWRARLAIPLTFLAGKPTN
ncbi:alpha/beta hydrolase [Chitinimonas sp. BJYL2]|uniref:alpha/beta hydrolase n=1 Tax=Chitinimonas sp. BJYL2 TaxID=2976696 RepID=UPI0022B3CFE2|nr:alpha/beta hydrolase-fold protein [Chitinimonas sp. BJYL2]